MAWQAENRRPPAKAGNWRLWVDTGGTFTDCLAVAPDGSGHRAKVLSSGRIRTVVAGVSSRSEIEIPITGSLPEDFYRGARLSLPEIGPVAQIKRFRSEQGALELSAPVADLSIGSRIELVADLEAPILAAHWVTRTPLASRLPAMSMRLATTRGTNALLERKGSPTALFITAGFADLLEIGTQQRPDLFAVDIQKPRPLYAALVEVEERIDSAGAVHRPLAFDGVTAAARHILERGIRVAAVALLNSFRNPAHERALATLLYRLGFSHVSSSSQLAPLIKILPRAQTAVVNAYLSEIIGAYLAAVDNAVEPGPLHVMTSTGGLVKAQGFLPKDSLLSGPAGGVVGAVAAARRSGFSRSLAFDMGGTSTDVSRFDGELEYRFETAVGDARLLSPSLAIETVAAGGGSICHFSDDRLQVGPQSAGASPGPACYGGGGPLTLTDVNLLLGRLRVESFEIPIDVAAASRAAEDLLDRVAGGGGGARLDEMNVLNGLLEIANERMAEAVRRISLRRGYRPRDYALVAFGGAGGQHACAVADLLQMETVLVPVDAGLLSAVGLGAASVERIVERQVLQPLRHLDGKIGSMFAELGELARAAVTAEGIAEIDVEIHRHLIFLRLAGQETPLELQYAADRDLEEAFLVRYADAYGYLPEGREIEVESVRVVARSRPPAASIGRVVEAVHAPVAGGAQTTFVDGSWRELPVYWREQLSPGARATGPALVFEKHSATLVAPGWDFELDGARCLVLRHADRGQRAADALRSEAGVGL